MSDGDLPEGFTAMQGSLTADDVSNAVEGVMVWARENLGDRITPESIELRLWAAAMLIYGCQQQSIPENIDASVEQKLAILNGKTQ